MGDIFLREEVAIGSEGRCDLPRVGMTSRRQSWDVNSSSQVQNSLRTAPLRYSLLGNRVPSASIIVWLRVWVMKRASFLLPWGTDY